MKEENQIQMLIDNNHIMGGNISRSAEIHSNVKMNCPIFILKNSEIHNNCDIGRYSFINANTIIYSNVTIGRYTSIGRNCEIGLAEHPSHFLSTHLFQTNFNFFNNIENIDKIKRVEYIYHKKTEIGHDVWIGSNVLIKSGVKIGNGAIIGAGAIVTKDIEPFSVVVGNPAKLIKKRFSNEIINKLLQLEWWKLDIKDLHDLPFDNVEKCVQRLREYSID